MRLIYGLSLAGLVLLAGCGHEVSMTPSADASSMKISSTPVVNSAKTDAGTELVLPDMACEGCTGQCANCPVGQDASAEVLAASDLPASNMTVEFLVPDMTCEGCAGVAEEILVKHPGVIEAKVDLATKLATAKVDSGKFDKNAALADLQKDFAGAKLAN